MPKPKLTRLDRLRRLIEEIEAQGETADISEMSAYLQTFAERTRVRSMPLYQQRNAIAAASLVGDKAALRAFEQSQYPEIVSWAKEAQQPRGPSWPRITV